MIGEITQFKALLFNSMLNQRHHSCGICFPEVSLGAFLLIIHYIGNRVHHHYTSASKKNSSNMICSQFLPSALSGLVLPVSENL